VSLHDASLHTEFAASELAIIDSKANKILFDLIIQFNSLFMSRVNSDKATYRCTLQSSIVVKEPRYKLEGHGFETTWGFLSL
jgi:hypothetical protein